MKTEFHEGEETGWLAKVAKVAGSEKATDKHTEVLWEAFHAVQAP